jgi:hypothetical protein
MEGDQDEGNSSIHPISNLPYEIFIFIFKLIVLDARDSLTLIPITHVSRYWRETALEAPALWTYLTGSSVIGELLSRSKDADLSVRLTQEDLAGPKLLNGTFASYLARNSHRVREITVHSPAWAIDAILRLLGTAPNLEVVVLMNTSFIVPADVTELLESQDSHLRELSLEAVDISWNSLCLSQLTTLTLNGVYLDTLEFLPAFRQMRKLEHFDASDYGERDTWTICHPHPDAIVTLPSLRTLVYRGSASSCFPILSHLELSPSISIALSISIFDRPPPVDLFASIIHRIFGTDREVVVRADQTSIQFVTPDHSLQLETPAKLGGYAFAALMQLGHLNSLRIGLHDALSITEGDWAIIFHQMSGLHLLDLKYNHWAKAVFDVHHRSTGSLPFLKKLVVRVDQIERLEDKDVFSRLHAFLQGRPLLGLMILVEHLGTERLSREKTKNLEELVQELRFMDARGSSF